MPVQVGSSDSIIVICCEHLTELRILEEAETQEVGLLTAPDKVRIIVDAGCPHKYFYFLWMLLSQLYHRVFLGKPSNRAPHYLLSFQSFYSLEW